MVLALTACGGKPAPEEPAAPAAAEPEATPEPEELPPANALDETSPIPADNYHGELTEQVFEAENLRLQLPEGVTAVNEGATDTFDGIPDGVTVHLPACLSDDERAAEELLRGFGLPDATVFDYYSLR